MQKHLGIFLLLLSLVQAQLTENDQATLIVNQNTFNDVIQTPPTSTGDKGLVSQQYLYTPNASIINLPAQFDVIKGMKVLVSVPLIRYEDLAGKIQSGVGDVGLGVNYHVKQLDAKYGMHIIQIKYKSTTGDAAKSLGSGASNFMFSHKFNMIFEDSTIDTAFSYTSNGSYNGTDYGNATSFVFSGTAKSLFKRPIEGTLKLSYFKSENNTVGTAVFGKTTNVDLWIEFASSAYFHTPLSFGLKLPLYAEANNLPQAIGMGFFMNVAELF